MDCPMTPADLPESAWVNAADPRLRDAVVVLKDDRTLALYRDGALAGCWRIALASGYVPGHKRRQGDRRTPEGWYQTSDRPWSAYHGAITVHYPRAVDAEAALADGRVDVATRDRIVAAERRGVLPPMNTALGGEIVIHGGGNASDWTLGCVGMADGDIDALRAALPSLSFDLLVLP
jgi:murein L,D-transpeptidase YafK